MANPDFLTYLTIGTRRIHGVGGEVTVRETVQCPARGVSLATETCFECDDCVAPTGDAAATLCIHPALHPGPPIHAVQRPTVSTVMTRNVECVTKGLSLDGLVTLFVERGISAVPVVDDHGCPTGIASKTDVVRWYHEGNSPGATTSVEDIMMPIAFTLEESAPLAFAAALMATESVHHIPVVSPNHQVVGIVSALDLVGWMAEREGFTVTRRP